MKFGTWMSLLGILAGLWISVSPYLVGFAPTHGNPWSGIVLGTDILGLVAVLASLVGLAAFWGIHLKHMSENRPSFPED